MRLIASFLMAALLVCAQNINPEYLYQKGRRAEGKGQIVEAYLLYAQAAAADPDNTTYWSRAQALRTRATLAAKTLPPLGPPPAGSQSGYAAPAPTKEELNEARQPQPPIELAVSDARRSFNLRADAKSLFEQIAKAYSLDVVFDGDYQPGQPVRLELSDVGQSEALYIAQVVTGSFIVPISPKLFLVVKDTPQKRTEQETSIAVTIPLPSPVSVQEAQELGRGVQQLLELPKFAIDSSQRLVLIRGPRSKVEPAYAIFRQMLQHRPQVYLEVDIMNVSKSATTRFGIAPQTAFTVSAPNALRALTAWGSPLTYLRIGIAGAQVFAERDETRNRSLLHSELRAVDMQPVSLHVGDKYPIVQQTLAPFLPPGGGTTDRSWEYREIPDDGLAPPARADAALVYDPSFRRLYLFGGRDANGAALDDFWVYSVNQQAWTELTPLGLRPSARYGHSLVIDRRGRLYLYGGLGATLLPDLWAYDPVTGVWGLLSRGDSGAPAARYGHAAIYEPVREQLIVTHGCGAGERLNDTWAFDLVGGGWRDLDPEGDLPEARCGGGAVYLLNLGQMMLYGGARDDGPLSDLWVYDFFANGWVERTPSRTPPGRERVALSYDLVRGVVYLYGGTGAGLLADTWVYDLTRAEWTQLRVPEPPLARAGASGAYLSDSGEFVVFGGATSEGVTADFVALKEVPGSTVSVDTTPTLAYSPPPLFTFEDLGLTLKITPKIHDAETVSLDVEAEFKTLGVGGFNGIPVISNRRFATRVRLRFNEAAVVAGLMTASEASGLGGFAGLGGLTGLSAFVSDNTRKVEDNQALLVIRPRLLDGPPEPSGAPIWTGTETRPFFHRDGRDVSATATSPQPPAPTQTSAADRPAPASAAVPAAAPLDQ